MVGDQAQNNLFDADSAYVKGSTATLALELLGLETRWFLYRLESSESSVYRCSHRNTVGKPKGVSSRGNDGWHSISLGLGCTYFSQKKLKDQAILPSLCRVWLTASTTDSFYLSWSMDNNESTPG